MFVDIFDKKLGQFSALFCGDQYWMFFMGSQDISSCVCGVKTRCFSHSHSTFPAMFVAIKAGDFH